MIESGIKAHFLPATVDDWADLDKDALLSIVNDMADRIADDFAEIKELHEKKDVDDSRARLWSYPRLLRMYYDAEDAKQRLVSYVVDLKRHLKPCDSCQSEGKWNEARLCHKCDLLMVDVGDRMRDDFMAQTREVEDLKAELNKYVIRASEELIQADEETQEQVDQVRRLRFALETIAEHGGAWPVVSLPATLRDVARVALERTDESFDGSLADSIQADEGEINTPDEIVEYIFEHGGLGMLEMWQYDHVETAIKRWRRNKDEQR